MKRNDLNAIITGIVHRYIEDGWVLEMDNASYSAMVIGTSMMPVRRMERRPRGARGRGASSTAMPLPVHSTPPRRSSTSGFARCTDGRTSSPPMSS